MLGRPRLLSVTFVMASAAPGDKLILGRCLQRLLPIPRRTDFVSHETEEHGLAFARRLREIYDLLAMFYATAIQGTTCFSGRVP